MNLGQKLREDYGPMMEQIANCEKPIIAGVNGVAAGAGFSLALACDFRLVSEKASFLNAFVNIGLILIRGICITFRESLVMRRPWNYLYWAKSYG